MGEHPILDHPPLPAGRTVAYGSRPHQVYEVHGGATSARGWVVLLHGGFWRERFDRSHLRPLAVALAEQGYAVALPEYVRTGMAGGGWPGTFDDVAAALAALRRDEIGGAPFVLMGHSAGGHLAVRLLEDPAAEGTRGAVSLAGCLDLTLAAKLHLGDGAVQALLHGEPADHPDTYAEADPALRGAAPYPVVVVHGTEDQVVPLAVATSWWERCASPGRDELVAVEGMGHFGLIDPADPVQVLVRDRLEGLLAAR